jgi:lysozyme
LSYLLKMLMRHEGLRLKAYLCTSGKLTIGCGRNIEDVGITAEEALMLLDNDIHRSRVEATRAFPWFPGLIPERQDVILSMLFNMGMKRLSGFKGMISAIQKEDYELAASEMLNSKWASQVKGRAVELAEMMRSGRYLD